MDCQLNCGACCIAPSISSPIPGMPNGKPSGTRCLHLTEDLKCAIFTSPNRPKVCDDFKADPEICADGREVALKKLYELEEYCKP